MPEATMQQIVRFAPLVLLVLVMYFLMIRPQKKKEKQISDMRNSIQVGDEIITIGGICGKVIKTKDETLVIQVGADKVKFEITRWAVSTVTKEGSRPYDSKNTDEEDEPKKAIPKRLRKSSDVDDLENKDVE